MGQGAFLVAVEGVDGAGKNTLTRAITTVLEQAGIPVSHVSFPRYGTCHADLAAQALHGGMRGLVDCPEAMAMLFALDRRESIRPGGELADYLERDGEVIILDRWVASNAAYSAARISEDAAVADGIVRWVAQLEYGTCALPRPHLTLLLDVPVELALQRARGREAVDEQRRRDTYERDTSLQERTAQAYRTLADLQWEGEWRRVSPETDPQRVAQEILEKLSPRSALDR